MKEMKIPFNKPYLTGKEVHFLYDAIYTGKASGNGKYTKLAQEFFQKELGSKKCLMTTSCTDALEMTALLLDIKPGDEIIVPSFTFVSSALAFVRQGAVIRFADSREDYPAIDENKIEELINEKTKAIVVVHYAGIACDMDAILKLSSKYNLFLIEDAAQAVRSYYKGRPLGSIGDFGCFSFHETKNIHCGEGGLLAVNNEKYSDRSEILWEKGTNRAAFFRGEIQKYEWVDTGSSFLPSDIQAAFLYAQIENLDAIQSLREQVWKKYDNELAYLEKKGYIKLPYLPDYATNNSHIFYILTENSGERDKLLDYLKERGILAVFHYLSLHKSGFYKEKHDGRVLPNSDRFAETLIRLPLYTALSEEEQQAVIETVFDFYLS